MTVAGDLFDEVRDALIVHDEAGVILAWNAAATALYGWTAANTIGKSMADLFDSETASADDVDREVTRRRSDGQTVVVEVRTLARKSAHDRPEWLEIGRDLTAQRRMEHQLRRSELRYSSLFQAMAAAFWELDFAPVGALLRQLKSQGVTDMPAYFRDNPEFVREMMRRTRVVDVNETTLEMFGIGDRSRLAPSVEPYWPEDSTEIYARAVTAAIGRKSSYKTETRLRRQDGSEFDVLFTAAFPNEGLAQGALLVGVIDISQQVAATAELARSETRYRNLFHDMPIALWQIDARALTPVLGALKQQGVTDLDAHMDAHPELLEHALQIVQVEGVNRRTVELFGGRSEADFLGPVARFWRACPETFRRSLVARYAGELTHSEETRVVGLDGRVSDIHYTIAFPGLLSEFGISIIGAIDIGDRLAAQADLRTLQNEFAHAARVSMLGELTASIAHEVNQPLAAISTNAAASLRWIDRPEPEIEKVRALTARIGDDARRAAEVIARVRSMATKQAGERSQLNLRELVEEAQIFLKHELQAREARVANHVPPGLHVGADRTQLQQVMVNLIMNAVQASAPLGPPWITIDADEVEGMLELTVADNGPGLGDGVGNLFTSFFTTKTDGLGLGLPICRSIVEAHGGAISAANARDGGAVFTIRLPLDPPHTKV